MSINGIEPFVDFKDLLPASLELGFRFSHGIHFHGPFEFGIGSPDLVLVRAIVPPEANGG